jgi:hypothetical protein
MLNTCEPCWFHRNERVRKDSSRSKGSPRPRRCPKLRSSLDCSIVTGNGWQTRDGTVRSVYPDTAAVRWALVMLGVASIMRSFLLQCVSMRADELAALAVGAVGVAGVRGEPAPCSQLDGATEIFGGYFERATQVSP